MATPPRSGAPERGCLEPAAGRVVGEGPGSGQLYLLGYARVSTTEQNTDLQHDDLTAAGC